MSNNPKATGFGSIISLLCFAVLIFLHSCTFSEICAGAADASLELASVTSSVNGYSATETENGDLSFKIKVSNSRFSGKAIIFVAIYEDNSLERVYTKKHTFAATESVWSFSQNCGYVTREQCVSVFLWNRSTLRPFCSPYVVPSGNDNFRKGEVYVNVGFEGSSNLFAKFNGKGNDLYKGEDESGEPCCVFKRTCSSDFHLDMHTQAYPAEKIVYQYDIKVVSDRLTYYSNLIQTDGNATTIHYLQSGALVADSQTLPLDKGKWYTISSVYDTEDHTVDVYLDYAIVAEDIDCGKAYNHVNSKMWRIHVPISSYQSDFYLDNICIYAGDAPRSLDGVGYTICNRVPIADYTVSDVYERPDQYKIRSQYSASALNGMHPRVMADKADFDKIRGDSASDDFTIFMLKYILPEADALLEDTDPLIYELRDGVRLLQVSYDMIDHMTLLGLAYQLTGDTKYAERAWIDLKSVAGFPDWHPDHALDVGAMAVGYAIGYDWMYDAFSDEQRSIIEEGVYRNGFAIYAEGYQGRHAKMVTSIVEPGNHCMVMNAGATMLGIAFSDVFPELSAYCISSAIHCLEAGIQQFTPDGEWFEGMGYTNMTVEYLVYQLSSLKKVFGSVYGLDRTAGLSKINEYYLYMQSPQGTFSYSDGASQNIHFEPGLLWFAEHYNDFDELSAFNNLYGFIPDMRTVLWYRGDKLGSETKLSPDKHYTGQEVLTMRDSWVRSQQTTFAAMKGFVPDYGHGHLDSGTFAFFANGVRWTYEYGSENYNLPGYWVGDLYTSPRWQYFRLRAEGHNCLVINPDEYGEYDPGAVARFERVESGVDSAVGVLDMTASHRGKAVSAKRGIHLTDNRKSMVIRDEVTLSENSTLYWFMHTDQNVSVNETGTGLVLTSASDPGNALYIDFVSSHPYEIAINPAVPLESSPHPEGMADDSAIKRIEVKAVADGNFTFTAKLTPYNVVNATAVSQYDVPVDTWSAVQ